MQVIDLKEVIENIDIRYSSAKNNYIQINTELCTKEEAFQLACNLLSKGQELLDMVKHEMISK